MTIMKRAEDYEDILKRKFTQEQRDAATASGAAMPGGGYPIEDAEDLSNAIRAVGRGKAPHATIRAHIRARAKSLGLTSKLPDTWKAVANLNEVLKHMAPMLSESDDDEGAAEFEEVLGEQQLTEAFWQAFYQGTTALQGSLTSILKDDAVVDKGPLTTESLQQFADYIEGILPGQIGKSLSATVAAIAGRAGQLYKGTVMLDELKKALGLPSTATEAEVTKAAEALATRNAELSKMSAKHAAFDGPMPKGGKAAFEAMSPNERDDHIASCNDSSNSDVEKALKAGDAFRTPEGVLITKAKLGDEMYAVMKANNDRVVTMAADLAKAKDREDEAVFAKRAEDLGFEASFGATMRKAYNGDAAAQVDMDKQLKALRKQAEEGGLFKTFGNNQPGEGSAEAELVSKIETVQKADPTLTYAQAYTKVYTDRANAPIIKRMKEEAAA